MRLFVNAQERAIRTKTTRALTLYMRVRRTGQSPETSLAAVKAAMPREGRLVWLAVEQEISKREAGFYS